MQTYRIDKSCWPLLDTQTKVGEVDFLLFLQIEVKILKKRLLKSISETNHNFMSKQQRSRKENEPQNDFFYINFTLFDRFLRETIQKFRKDQFQLSKDIRDRSVFVLIVIKKAKQLPKLPNSCRKTVLKDE